MAQHNIFVDLDRSVAVRGASDSSIAELPPFVQGDSLQLKVWLLTGYSPLASYSKVPVSGITLQVAIGDKVGNDTNYYTQQFTWTASEDLGQPYFAATLPLNTAEITTLIGSAASRQAWLEIKMIEGATPVSVLSQLVTVHAAVIKEGGLTVPAELTPLSAEAANAAFVRVIHTGSFDLMNSNGKGVRVYCDEDGAFHADPIT